VVKVLGVAFRLSSGTEFGNSDRKELNAESIDDLAVGARVRIRAHLDGETVSVGRIDRLKPDDDAELIAIVSAKSQEPLTITLLGSEIVLSEETELRADERVDPAGFFDAAHVGDFVRVRWGDSADGSAAPDRMELLSD
jgi:hypothetical protein